MQQELMAHLTREAEAGEARRVEAADEDAQWAAELESSLAALPEPPRFSHAPVGGAPPAGRESLQAQGQAANQIQVVPDTCKGRKYCIATTTTFAPGGMPYEPCT